MFELAPWKQLTGDQALQAFHGCVWGDPVNHRQLNKKPRKNESIALAMLYRLTCHGSITALLPFAYDGYQGLIDFRRVVVGLAGHAAKATSTTVCICLCVPPC